MRRWLAGLILAFFVFLFLPLGYSQEKIQNVWELYDASMELYYKNRCEEAMKGFSKIIQSAPTSTLVSYSQYMIGLCYLKMKKHEEAIQQLEVYLKAYPDGDRAKEAEKGIQIEKEQLEEKLPPQSSLSKP